MDFSTILKVNIYVLGSCYLKIIEKLHFKNLRPEIPLLDPQYTLVVQERILNWGCLYIFQPSELSFKSA